MFSLNSLSTSMFGFGRTAKGGTPINLPPVAIQDVEVATDKRGRRLKHLLKLNHANFSVLYHHLQFDNHNAHILGSAYILGGDSDHLTDVYEAESKQLEPWVDSPGEISSHDYRDFLGRRDYQRAWVDFFEDQLVQEGYDWKGVVLKFLFETGPKNSPNALPMFNSMIAGLTHPLIQLGYAFELNSREVAMEALGLIASCYDPKMASMLETDSPKTSTANPLTYSTSNIFEVLARCHGDSRLDGNFKHPGSNNLSELLSSSDHAATRAIMMEHWAAWKLMDPTKQFEQSQQLAAALLIASAPSVGSYGYDFFLVHLLTSSHAMRIVITFIPPKYHIPLLREWFLIVVALYIAQTRPLIDVKFIHNVKLEGRDWSWVEKLALSGKHKFDAHFVKAVRALKEAATVWGDKDEFYLKAAVKFAGEFQDWAGFGG